jgi:glycosylphosphatidylinositol transamidase (GPIT) subunit GPI8
MKSNDILILAVTTTLPIAALADSANPKKIGRHVGTNANVLIDGNGYDLTVDDFFDHIPYGELPAGRCVRLD